MLIDTSSESQEIRNAAMLVNQACGLVLRLMHKNDGSKRYYSLVHHAKRREERRQGVLNYMRFAAKKK